MSGRALQRPWDGSIGGEHRGHLLGLQTSEPGPTMDGRGHGGAIDDEVGGARTDARSTGREAAHMRGARDHRDRAVLSSERRHLWHPSIDSSAGQCTTPRTCPSTDYYDLA